MTDVAEKALVLGLGTLLAGACAYVVFGIDRDAPEVGYRVVAVVPEGPEQIRVTFQVDKPPGTGARCQVAAFTESGASAGRLNDVLVRPRQDGGRTTVTTVVVPTGKEARSASVAQCVVVPAGG